MTTPTHRIDLLETEAQALLAYLQSLPRESWERASACEGWTVADVVGHLTSVDFAPRMLRGLAGDHSPPEGSPPPEQHDEDAFAQSIYQRAIDARERLGDGLLDDFTQRVSEAVSLFRQVGRTSGTTWSTGRRALWPSAPC